MDGRSIAVMSAVLAAIAMAPSPAAAIAIIKEMRAKGPFTETALALIVALDILAIVVFAIVASAGQSMLTGSPLELGLLAGLSLQILLSAVLGAGLGLLLGFWLKRVKGYHLVSFFILAVLVSELSGHLSEWLEDSYQLRYHLEPMLICIAAGFVVRNFSAQGERFMQVIDQGGLMVYTVFFALAGASLDLDLLRSGWGLALVLLVLRAVAGQAGSWTGLRLAGAPSRFRRLMGLTLVTQAAVSLGLAMAVRQRFPDWGPAVATLAVASVSLSLLVGPVLFRLAMLKAGEGNEGRN
jgi:Kef-type K+ transport system membrane component KefB